MTWLPLTSAQRGLYFAHELNPDNPCYTTAEVVDLNGSVDVDRLAAAHASAYAEFEQLHIECRATASGPEQRPRSSAPDLQRVSVANTDEASAWIETELTRPMDLSTGDVVRAALLTFPDGQAQWFHAAHHVVLDGYGALQLLRRICELYNGAPAAPPDVALVDLVADDLRRGGDVASRAFWDARLATMSGTSSLAGRVAPPAASAIKRSLVLPPHAQHALVDGARRLGVGWPDLFLAAVGGYVARMARTPTARLGLPLMNRTIAGVGTLPAARTVCTAMNVLPATIPTDGTVAEALTATAIEQAALRQFPFERQEDLSRRLARRTGGQLFGPQVNVLPFDLELRLGDVTGVVRNLTAGPVEDMTICLRGAPGRGRTVRLEIDANPNLYSPDDIHLHLERLTHWLDQYVRADPETPIARLSLLPEAERNRILKEFNDTSVTRQTATLGRRFVSQARRSPNATALVFGNETRTYAELLGAAQRIAADLSDRGVRPGDVVGVALDRGFALYETVHALALLGAVYLPLDLDLPTARIDGMLADANAALVIRHGDDVGTGTADSVAVFDQPDGPAYLLFTSGSTGRPKGVVVDHRAIDNRLAWMQHHLPLHPGDRVLHKTPISFDVSVWELFWPLQVGATVVIAAPGAHRDPRAIADLVVEERIDVLHFVPSMLRALLADRLSRERVEAGQVRTVVTSGEALTTDLVVRTARWFGVSPVNLYGPTEAAIDVTCWDTSVDDTVVPIGRPIWNTSCYIVDDDLTPVPIGMGGELWLGGVQLAVEYIGRPDLTAERFVTTPYGRLYRTGDLASWRPDGAIRYLGRVDDQVKLRGQRIELGEIETTVATVPGLVGIAAGVVDDTLVCWFVPEAEIDPDLLERELRSAAAAHLPPSFLPNRWISVPGIPLSPSGKIDRRRLTECVPAQSEDRVGGSPRDLLEQRLCELIGDIVGTGSVAPDDDFFDIGGDSLRVLQLLSDADAHLGLTMSLADVFAHPTASTMAALVETERRGGDFAEVLILRPIAEGSGRPPLVLLPPAGGLGWCYSSLLRSLPSEQGVVTVQAPGIAEGRPEPVADLATLAYRQLAAIRKVVGNGPFHVGGWSLGGMAAQAVAAVAAAEGQDVGRVILIDAYPSDQWHHLDEPTEEEALVGILRLGAAEHLVPHDVTITRQVVAEALRSSGSALPDRVLDGCVASVVESSRLIRTSRHSVYRGDLDVVVATAHRSEHWLDAQGWQVHAEGSVRIHDIDAGHGDLLRRPAADQVGTLIDELLR